MSDPGSLAAGGWVTRRAIAAASASAAAWLVERRDVAADGASAAAWLARLRAAAPADAASVGVRDMVREKERRTTPVAVAEATAGENTRVLKQA